MTSKPSSSPPDRRVFFRDVKPYAVVDDLDLLRGPAGGQVELSHSVLWAPGGGRVELDEPGGAALAYQAVLAGGDVDDLVQVLNRGRLIAAWSQLMLPQRLRRLWEDRFPELRSTPGPGAGRAGRPVSPRSPEQDREAAVQREVTRIALSGARGFALYPATDAVRQPPTVSRTRPPQQPSTPEQDVER